MALGIPGSYFSKLGRWVVCLRAGLSFRLGFCRMGDPGYSGARATREGSWEADMDTTSSFSTLNLDDFLYVIR